MNDIIETPNTDEKQDALNLLGKEAMFAKRRGDIRRDKLFSIAIAALKKDMGIFEEVQEDTKEEVDKFPINEELA